LAFPLAGISGDDFMHFVLSGLSIVLLLVSANVFRKLRTGRYFLLVLAFAFFALDQLVTLWQQLYFNDALLTFPVIGLHVTHFLELLMSVSFIAALVYRSSFDQRRLT
jgi:hypothetical protein